jgi:hypothetical protein
VDLTGIDLPLQYFPRMAVSGFSMLLVSRRFSTDFEISVNSNRGLERFRH